MQDPRAARPAQADRAPRPTVPEADPRQATPRPRPAGAAWTGQLPSARVRDVPNGPTGTARIPVVRQAPPTAAPRPSTRQPDGPRPPAQPPVRSRLRTAPPAPPLPLRTDAPVAPGSARPASLRPVPQAAPVRPFSQLTPVAVPLPPTPTESAPDTTPVRRRRRPLRALVSILGVLALGAVWALPAFASEALDPPPVGGVATSDVQSLHVPAEVDGGAASTDAVSGSLPVAAAPAWLLPVVGRLGDPFGPRPEQPVPGVSLFHRGQDIVAPCGRPIRAAASGTVTTATYWGTYGNWILIDHGDGVAVGYAHESRMLVSPGQRVTAGQVIGLVGETGAATGCHLHLEVHVNGVAINPVPFFAAKHITL